jgi:hypothetical protein
VKQLLASLLFLLLEEWVYSGFLQVLIPPISSYLPFSEYPFEMTGGMLQQASLWPCCAGIVDILVELVGCTLEKELLKVESWVRELKRGNCTCWSCGPRTLETFVGLRCADLRKEEGRADKAALTGVFKGMHERGGYGGSYPKGQAAALKGRGAVDQVLIVC